MQRRSLYEFEDYKAYFNHWVEAQPKQGHGEYRRVAEALKISTTMVSQVFKGDKHLSLEMACELCDYLNHTEEETEFFLLLVEYQRAGSHKLSSRLLKQIRRRQQKSLRLENRVQKDMEISEEVKAVFYSSWIYSGIRLLSDISEIRNASDMAARLNLPKNMVQKVLDFLLDHRLCVMKNGQVQMGPTITHVGASNLLTVKHHQNWRLQAFNKMISPDDQNFFFTGPMVMSQEVANAVRMKLPTLVQETVAAVKPSKSEVVRCLNIDWFEF